MAVDKEGRELKWIRAHSDEELDDAIDEAVAHCGEHGLVFMKILHGVDAYMERRRRRIQRARERQFVEPEIDGWGRS